MKKPFLYLIACLLVAGVSSCKKDDETAKTTPAVSNLMTAKVDGVNWTAMSSKVTGSIESNLSNCTGTASDSSIITFSVTDEWVVNGVYDLGFGSANNAAYTLMNGSMPWLTNGNASCTGTMKVTAINTSSKKMSGTFSFKAFNSLTNTFVNITDGVFTNVTYTSSLSGTTNIFNVKIDGVNWVPSFIIGAASNGDISIDAVNTTGDKSVTLVFPETITPGSYTLDGTSYIGSYSPNLSTFTISTSGTLVISSHNTSTGNIVGTFNFVAQDLSSGGSSYNLTNGSFSVNY